MLAIVVLGAGLSGVLGQVRRGALFQAVRCGLSAVVGIVASWGRTVSGITSAGRAAGYAANRVVRFALADPDLFTGRARLPQAIFGLFGAFALIGAAIVLFLSQRADNALTGEDESAIRTVIGFV